MSNHITKLKNYDRNTMEIIMNIRKVLCYFTAGTRKIAALRTATLMLSLTIVGSVSAGSTTATGGGVPNIFVPGTPISSSEVNDNFSDLDIRLEDLEISVPSNSTEANIVFVDCDTTPNFFLEAPFNTTSDPDTIYDISGTCNGPVLIRDDNVTLNAASAGASIVLPAGLTFETSPIEFLVAIYVFGANDVKINNLVIDASAFNLPAFDGENTGVIWARNSFVTLEDITALGGAFTIAAFDNATIRSNGTLSINDFFNEGFSAGQQGNIIVQGSVDFFSSNTPGGQASVISAFGDGHIDIRGDISIFTTNPTANIFAGENSYVRVRNGQDATLPGTVSATGNSRILLDNVTVDSSISATEDSNLVLNNVRQTGSETVFNIDNSQAKISDPGSNISSLMNVATSSLVVENATIDSVFARSGSNVSISNANTRDIELDNSRANIDDSTIDGRLVVNNGSTLQVNLGNQTTTQDPGMELNGASTAIIGSSSTLVNGILVNQGSFLSLNNVTQAGSPMAIDVDNSRALINNSTTGDYTLSLGSNVSVDNGSVNGALLFSGSTLRLNTVSVNGNIGLFNSGLSASGTGLFGAGTFNNNSVFLCGNQLSVAIDGLDLSVSPTTPFGLAASGTISSACSDGSPPPASPPSAGGFPLN